MKFFSFFLPQFHQIRENDEWWGKGFTEWNKVKTAKPLYKGHNQPQIPLNHNYYNLLDKTTMEWQTELMHEYGLYGMVYYHYYFQGKLLLEKPAENLLRWKEIDQPFFFCWANHSWRRTWEGKQTILLEQTYGEENDWENHFQYLIRFFQDSRYEKINNCPVFMIYSPAFSEKNAMMKYFDKRCKESGFNGIYLIECSHGQVEDIEKLKEAKPVDHYKILLREPEYSKIKYYDATESNKVNLYGYSLKNKIEKLFYRNKTRVKSFSGNALFLQKIKNYKRDQNLLQCICFSWDNTVRHGERGYVITPVEKKYFFKYMDTIKEEQYCFINAWNEWGEGMMLEPTERDGYKYLEWIKQWVNAIT